MGSNQKRRRAAAVRVRLALPLLGGAAPEEWTWPVGKPLVDGFGLGLLEVRSGLDGNIYRVLFCLEGGVMVLLHGFQKKTQKTPQADLDLARYG